MKLTSQSPWRQIFSRPHNKSTPAPVEEYPRPQVHRIPEPHCDAPEQDISITTPRTSTDLFPSTVPASQPSTYARLPSPISTADSESFHKAPSHSRTPSNPSSSRPITPISIPPTPRTPLSPSPSSHRHSTIPAIANPDPDCPLVLTLTSKYPTGVAGELYVPVDVSVPSRRTNLIRSLPRSVRPSSMHMNFKLNVSLPAPHSDSDTVKPQNVLRRRMSRVRKETLSEANRFYY